MTGSVARPGRSPFTVVLIGGRVHRTYLPHGSSSWMHYSRGSRCYVSCLIEAVHWLPAVRLYFSKIVIALSCAIERDG